MQVTATIRTFEVRIGDHVEVPDGTKGEVTQIVDYDHRVVLRLDYCGTTSYHILRDGDKLTAVLEDDGEPMSDIAIYGAGA